MMVEDKPKTCIIGAGISGLSLGKELKARNIPYVCYEKSSVVGGTWAFKNPNGTSAAYRSLHIDTSKEEIEWPDYPMPDDYPDFPHHSQIYNYLCNLVDHFGLRENIRFNTEVVHASRLPDGAWQITLDNGESHRYETLVVANGHHWDPHWPDFPGHFNGEAIHSHQYIDAFEPLVLRGKRVLIVGIGNSAVDIACELSNRSLADKVVLSTRRGAHVIPKYLFGRPIDQVLRTYPYIPYSLQRKWAALMVRLAVGRPQDYGLPIPDHDFLQAHPTVSSELLHRVAHGLITVKPDIERFEGHEVRFVDGTTAPFDAIIYATGYNVTFPFFDEAFVDARDNRLPLFKRSFIPGIDNLIFIGLAQPIPSLIGFVQSQAEWIAEYLAGTYRLPSVAEMEDAIRRDEALHTGHFVGSRRHTMEVDQRLYAHDLQKELQRGRRRAAGQSDTGDRGLARLVLGAAILGAGLVAGRRFLGKSE